MLHVVRGGRRAAAVIAADRLLPAAGAGPAGRRRGVLPALRRVCIPPRRVGRKLHSCHLEAGLTLYSGEAILTTLIFGNKGVFRCRL